MTSRPANAQKDACGLTNPSKMSDAAVAEINKKIS